MSEAEVVFEDHAMQLYSDGRLNSSDLPMFHAFAALSWTEQREETARFLAAFIDSVHAERAKWVELVGLLPTHTNWEGDPKAFARIEQLRRELGLEGA